VTICTHCQQSDEDHTDSKCLFSPTEFSPLRCHVCKDVLASPNIYPRADQPSDWWFKQVNGHYRHFRCPVVDLDQP
jgi:hypothetical protein